ncbi:hypothetical protein M4I32_03590 [Microbacterium sp. LRZ72]|uniref:hypothetical protein n=1 Tax=Microbacterium sp. LRZ72 TaxID=2942481 RepID=UPI0029A06209|nr:hypothetical protein [Microbacterium sp. LRZ72]MDX2375879.1 hypothetical protein [Microbacterium sp. LRZ72]
MQGLRHQQLTLHSSGHLGASRNVVLVREGTIAIPDPDPRVTSRFGVRLVSVGVPAVDLGDRESFGGETPDQEQAQALARALHGQGVTADRPAGLVALGGVGWRAVEAVIALGPAIDRVAFVGLRVPEQPLAQSDVEILLRRIEPEVLLVPGEHGEGADALAWITQRLPEGRASRAEGGSLPAVWPALMEHLTVGVGAE